MHYNSASAGGRIGVIAAVLAVLVAYKVAESDLSWWVAAPLWILVLGIGLIAVASLQQWLAHQRQARQGKH